MTDKKPCKPDWGQLKTLREKQQVDAMLRFHQAELDACTDEPAKETKIEELKQKWGESADIPIRSFLELTEGGCGESIFEDQADKSAAEKIICDQMFTLRDFEGGDAAIIQQLGPRQRKRLLEEGFIQATGEKKRKQMISNHEGQALEQLVKQTKSTLTAEQTKRKQELRDVLKEHGFEAARNDGNGVKRWGEAGAEGAWRPRPLPPKITYMI